MNPLVSFHYPNHPIFVNNNFINLIILILIGATTARNLGAEMDSLMMGQSQTAIDSILDISRSSQIGYQSMKSEGDVSNLMEMYKREPTDVKEEPNELELPSENQYFSDMYPLWKSPAVAPVGVQDTRNALINALETSPQTQCNLMSSLQGELTFCYNFVNSIS